MEPGKMVCLILAFTMTLLGSLKSPVQSQEEQAPAQAVEEEGQFPLANLLTAMNIPARGGLCILASLMGSLVMAISGGMRHADAAKMMEEGCSGPWIITPEMIDEGGSSDKYMSSGGSHKDERP